MLTKQFFSKNFCPEKINLHFLSSPLNFFFNFYQPPRPISISLPFSSFYIQLITSLSLLLESGFLVFMLFVGVISSSILFEMCNRLKILSHLSPILLCFFCFFCSFMHIKMYMLIYCLFPYL
jgi:hypothetical protein